MITLPSITALGKRDITQAWESRGSWNNSDPSSSKAFIPSAQPSDPLRQANRLPIKLLKMLTARSGHILHPEYLQPLPSTPVSPIELDAKKSPLALLAQTCSQIGKPDPSSSSKLSSVTSNGSSDKDAKCDTLKLSDIVADDKSSFKPYAKSSEKKDLSSGGSAGEKAGFRVPSATCQQFTPRTSSPQSSPSPSPHPAEGDSGERDEKESDGHKNCTVDASGNSGINHSRISVSCAGINVEVNQLQETASGQKPVTTSDASSAPSTSVLGTGLVAPVSPYKPGQTVFPLPSASISYPGALAGPYASYAQHFISHGSSLVNAQLASSLGCSKAGSSPLAGASPPSIMSAGLCRDPYCLGYHCASHLTGAANSSCTHDTAAAAAASVLKSGYPLMYQTHPLHTVHSSSQPLTGHPLYSYGFVLPNDPLPHVCNWVSANGPCDKRFSSSEELLNHLRSHTALTGTDKLISSYPGSSSLASAAAAAMACTLHMPPSGAPGSVGALAFRSPHHALALGSRYHPYSKSPLPNPGAPIPVPAGNSPYYSPYALYGQRLTTSALGYQ